MKQQVAAVLAAGILSAGVFGVVMQPALADDSESGVTLYLGGGAYDFDGERDLENADVIQIGLGYAFDRHFGIEAVYSDLSGSETEVGGIDADGEMWRLDGLYHLNPTEGGLIPYLAMGLGDLDIDIDNGTGDNEFVWNVGGGIKAKLTDKLSLRGDARAVRGGDNHTWDSMFTIGLNYAFGGTGFGSRDSDGDGVRDSVDECPNTPPGEAVNAVGCPLDSDNDGVIDATDQCPDTPAGIAVNGVGCPLDSDGDGVYDYQDECPGTPTGARVDEKGCQYVITENVSVELEVLFDYDKAVVKPAFFDEIKRVAEFMTLFPGTKARVEGHTDNRGDPAYNQRLSQQRADAVRQVLIQEHGIAANRVAAEGFGETKPRATNDTAEGRQQNRRVVAEIATEVEKPLTK